MKIASSQNSCDGISIFSASRPHLWSLQQVIRARKRELPLARRSRVVPELNPWRLPLPYREEPRLNQAHTVLVDTLRRLLLAQLYQGAIEVFLSSLEQFVKKSLSMPSSRYRRAFVSSSGFPFRRVWHALNTALRDMGDGMGDGTGTVVASGRKGVASPLPYFLRLDFK